MRILVVGAGQVGYAVTAALHEAHEITVAMPGGALTGAHANDIAEGFHRVHEKAYGRRDAAAAVEFMALNAEKKGSPVSFVFPAEGVSAVTEPVAALAPMSVAVTSVAVRSRAILPFICTSDGRATGVRARLPRCPAL